MSVFMLFFINLKIKRTAPYGEQVKIGVRLFERMEELWLTERF